MNMSSQQENENEAWRLHLYFQAALRQATGDIRLLTIQSRKYSGSMPAAPANSVHCILQLANLKSGLKYTAVSRGWEPSDTVDESKIVLVNGAPVPVTAGVFRVLEQFQEEDESTTVWIDALCVNHADAAEKSAQISQKPQIFSSATTTLIWLGETDENSDEAMDVLSQLANEHDLTAVGDRLLRSIIARSPVSLSPAPPGVQEPRSSGAPPSTEETDLRDRLQRLRPNLRALMERPYWKRLWSLHDLALSSSGIVTCGSKRIALNRFCTAARALDPIINESTISKWLASAQSPALPNQSSVLDTNEPSDFSHTPALQLLAERDFYRKDMGTWIRRSEIPLISILTRYYVPGFDGKALSPTLQVVDPRDRVYALLGLSTDANNLGLMVDYSKGCADLHVKTSIALLNQSPRLLQFARTTANTKTENKSEYPSWTVDWNHIQTPPSDGVASERPFQACGPADERFYRADLTESGRISVKGAVVDQIREVGSAYTHDYNLDTREFDHISALFSETRRFWDESLSMTATSPYTAEQTSIALAKVLVADNFRGSETTGIQGYQNLNQALGQTSEDKTGDQDNTYSSPPTLSFEASAYVSALARTAGRKPFLSSTGYIGLGPTDLTTGDTIAIPYGSAAPLALRRQDSELDIYQLVGEVYVFGIMDGEFMKVHRRETVLHLV
ncbi:heterokaryon incompatibility protein-domain-containing protein [Xylariaceae sp. FL0016]|nr:heterokaryon incompatibility protein-domain-containing protein [Xylariaceae sp. FL0016]